jgi:anti-sigma28 factor (negative regulator of flagellin synthesis)
MKIRITESQYNILINKSKDIVFGKINESGGRPPRETPEEIDAKIEEILNYVRNGGEFIRNNKNDNYIWLYTRKKNKKVKKALDQINEFYEEIDNKKIEEIKNYIRNGGKFIRNAKKDDYYKWLFSKSKRDTTGKFKNALDQIKKIQEELENKKDDAKIEEIKNYVRNGDVFTAADYNWLHYNVRRDKTEEQKFKKAFEQINEIQEELENKKIKEILNHVKNGGEFTRTTRNPYYMWLVGKLRYDKTEEQKFQNALDQIYKIQTKLGIAREWWGERVIKDTLIGLGFEDIPRQGQHTYKDCKNSLSCKRYKFDVYLPYNENNYMVGKNKGFYIPETGILFEYDGSQHFEFKPHFHKTEENFISQIHRDKEKNLFCKTNNIRMIRISYNEKDVIGQLNKGLKSKKQLWLSDNYPKAGWNK